MKPLAFLITWTTYGTWLHGKACGFVESGVPGIQPGDPVREQQSRSKMTEPPVVLNREQRAIVEKTIREHCDIRGWTLHAVNVRSNHVHVVVTADVAPEVVLSQFKAWCSRRLSEALGLDGQKTKNGKKRWWTEHGSTKWINDNSYLHNAIHYTLEGQ